MREPSFYYSNIRHEELISVAEGFAIQHFHRNSNALVDLWKNPPPLETDCLRLL
jgi:hypothetical protein